MKRIYALTIAMMLGSSIVFAQSQTQTDSIAKLNKELQITQDSLKKAQEKSATKTEPAPTSKESKKDNRPLNQRLSVDFSTSYWQNASTIYIEVGGMLTYKFPKVWHVGTGPVFEYNRNRDVNKDLYGWGARVYTRADITKWMFGWVEYQGIENQYLKYDDANPETKPTKDKEYVNSLYLSLGFSIHLGRKSINSQVLYDVLYKKSNAYTLSPWTYRAVFGF